ncbi:SDR family NAD(P)-dependent oxidoreductase [Subtercola endophyticus]|uniref:SDR family NAD(P)-dependent oxidoreductase n=1 Tax=Subtercola endophyticus TaxID=2895559 RepID=UPI001E5A0DDA|nr:SDR family oxidoreductase [Subtercola endophyticus]UFS58556.1 SDR family oxidoreductase [Subtercola endophyticus]
MTAAKVAVVTGAAGGIGRAIAEDLALHGWALVLVDTNELELSAAEEEFGRLTRVAAVVGDVAERATHVRAADAAATLGALVGWVNCAGITIREPLHAVTASVAERVIGVNQFGTLWGTSVALERMLEASEATETAADADSAESSSAVAPANAARRRTRGAIVNMSSVHAHSSYAEFAVYEMTKAAIEALTRNAAIAYGAQGIRVNAVAPGAVMTPALEASFASAPDPAGARQDLADKSALGRIADASEIASVVRFLLSDDASYVTGQSILIDGGWASILGRDSTDPSRRRTSGGSE